MKMGDIFGKIKDNALLNSAIEKIKKFMDTRVFATANTSFNNTATAVTSGIGVKLTLGDRITLAIMNILEKIGIRNIRTSKANSIIAKIINGVLKIISFVLAIGFGILVGYFIVKVFIPVIMFIAASFAICIVFEVIMNILNNVVPNKKESKVGAA